MRPVARLLVLMMMMLAAAACGGAPSPPGSSTSSSGSGAADNLPRAPISLPAPDPNLFQAPRPTEEQQRKIEDIRRDLMAVAAGSTGAVADLTDDLGSLMGHPPSPTVRADVAGSLDKALRGRSLDEPHSRRMAQLLYAALHLPYMPAQQRDVVRTTLVQELQAVGVGPADASAAATTVSSIK